MIGDTPPPLPALPLMCRNPIFIDEYMTLSMVHGSFYGGPLRFFLFSHFWSAFREYMRLRSPDFRLACILMSTSP